ncbi:hypothetical protein LEMLEM_LOCUS25948, partial [Lemmus lemmus]
MQHLATSAESFLVSRSFRVWFLLYPGRITTTHSGHGAQRNR